MNDVGGGGVGDVVRVGLDVQHGPSDAPVGQEVGDEEQVGDEFAAGVVGDEAQGARAGAAEQGPQALAVVGHQPGGGVRGPCALGGETEAEVGAVAPEGTVQQGLCLFSGGPGGEAVERGQFLVGLGGVEFGQFGGAEGVDALPGAGAEVADGLEEPAVEPALGPEPRHVEPGPAGVLAQPPGLPEVAVVRVGGERFDLALGAVRQEFVERAVLPGLVREGLAHLPDDGRVPLGEHAVGEGARLVAEEQGCGWGVGHAAHRSAGVPLDRTGRATAEPVGSSGPKARQTGANSRSRRAARLR
ncbi:hypothetical protein SAFG77S_00800 [Streptomyces afghaniensis]